MPLTIAAHKILENLRGFLEQIDDNVYAQPLDVFSEASLGQHTRHILEFFDCLILQHKEGVVNYDKRMRNEAIEVSTAAALNSVKSIKSKLESNLQYNQLVLEVSYNQKINQYQTLPTSFARELAYTIEHAIHHMAILKIGLKLVAPEIMLSDDFGIAPSTIKYRNKLCVQ